MGISKEAIDTILNCSFGEEEARPFRELGQIGDGVKSYYGEAEYPIRAVCLPGQPRILGATRQPTLVLEGKGVIKPLPYEADIKEAVDIFGEGVIEKLVDHVRHLTNPFVEPTIDGQEDY